MSSPAMRMEDLLTMPPSEIPATSLVPPPTSTIIDPCASLTGSPAPMAAASGSSMVNACPAPADPVAHLPAPPTTPLTPAGRGGRLLGGERRPGARGRRSLLNGPKLDPRNSRGHAHNDARADEGAEDPALGLDLADKVGEHLLRYLEVRDDAVL